MDLKKLGEQGVALFQQGRLAEAERLCAAMLAAAPHHFLSLHLEGLIRLRQGRLKEAEALLRAALESDPRSGQAEANLGNILAAAGRHGEALAAYDRALTLSPQPPEIHCNRGNVLVELRREAEALESYDHAFSRNPDLIEALAGKSNALQRLRRFAEAAALCDHALGRHPGEPRLLTNRAAALCGLGRHAEALADCDVVLAAQPNQGASLNNRADALLGLGRFAEALAAYDTALAVQPRPDNLVNRGHVLRELGRMDEALASYDKALALVPGHTLALLNRGIMLSEQRRFVEALSSLEQAMAADPAEPHALGLAANAALELCNWERAEVLGARLVTEAAAHRAIVPPLVLLGLNGDKSLQLLTARDFMRERVPAMPPPLCSGAAYGHDRIRLAYVSSDFNEHPVAAMIGELLERHDRARFEVIGISTGADDGSLARKQFEKVFDRFLDVRSLADEAVARQMLALETDIVIDLNGHTRGARPGILARRPAPVQAAWLGYAATMGADYIDYVIADAVVAPMADQPFFSEQIVHLPDSFWTHDSRRLAPATPSRAEAGLPESGFVFCCFNQTRKITRPVFDIWMRLLQVVPQSVLWLAQANLSARNNLVAAAAASGIEPARLIFAPRLPDVAQHLARHRLADLFLDTLPYNAHATSSDSLWMGVPVVTCRGEAFAGRVAASQLKAAGLEALVTESLADYEALALRLAREPASLRDFKERLAAAHTASALFNGDRFRRHLEAAFVRMVAGAGQAPQAFAVSPLD